MSAFDIWPQLGFTANPYSQETLPATADGSALLAGRENQIKQVQLRIGSGGSMPSVEGPIGAGKTSLLNVAIYRMHEYCVQNSAGQLWLPAAERFQPSEDADEFEAEVYRAILQTLVHHKDDFAQAGLPDLNLRSLSKWLMAPDANDSVGSGFKVRVLIEGEDERESDETTKFLRSGLPHAIRGLLKETFGGGKGGIVCVLDNLEIAGQVGEARRRLDELRDRVFGIEGVRWVLCGSRGVVSRVRTQRLSGVFMAPLNVQPLSEAEAVKAIELRIKHYGNAKAEAPLTPIGFEFFYNALHQNMRDAMSWAQQFSQWMLSEYPELDLPAANERDALAQVWLAERAQEAFDYATGIQKRVWTFFEDLCEAGGRIGSSEYEEFGFAKQQQFTSAVTALDAANLVIRETDPDDGTKTVNATTAEGWLVYFYRNNFELSSGIERANSTL